MLTAVSDNPSVKLSLRKALCVIHHARRAANVTENDNGDRAHFWALATRAPENIHEGKEW